MEERHVKSEVKL